MLRNSRIYLKRRIDESTVLDETDGGDDRGLTELKRLVVSIVNAAYNRGISDDGKGWAIHHINGKHGDNNFKNIALMTVEAHGSFHGSGYLSKIEDGYEALKAWLHDGAKGKGRNKDRKIVSYSELNEVYVLQDIINLNKQQPAY